MTKINLSGFLESLPWDERATLIRRTFSSESLVAATTPETELAWQKVFYREPELMGRILRDILKQEQAIPGRPGPRPGLDVARAEPLVDGWMGRDPKVRPYSVLPFHQAFQLLVEGRSIRSVANTVGLPRNTVHRLIRGQVSPTSDMMLRVAHAYKKNPSFFLEWRIGVISAAIIQALTNQPERSVKSYEALFWAMEGVE